MIIAPKIRGFICTTAHPAGCAKHVAEQIAVVKTRGPVAHGPKKVLVIGSSTGYGLSSRIAAAFGSNAATLGVFFEREGEADRTATAGWYNTAAFEAEAKAAGLYAQPFAIEAFGRGGLADQMRLWPGVDDPAPDVAGHQVMGLVLNDQIRR